MTFRSKSEEAAKSVFAALEMTPGDDQMTAVTKVIEQAVIATAAEVNQRCATVAQKCCSPDQDLAHKIAKEIEQTHVALIANLSAMR